MDEQRIRQIVQEEMQRNYRFGSPEVPPHRHDGVDNLAIDQRDISPNNPVFANIVSTTSETFTIDALPNITEISVFAFAANNAGGGAATQRATITGSAILANGYNLTSINPTSSISSPITQVCNFSFSNQTGPAFRVGLDLTSICYASDGTSDLAKVVIIGFNRSSVTFQVTLASGWQIQQGLIFY